MKHENFFRVGLITLYTFSLLFLVYLLIPLLHQSAQFACQGFNCFFYTIKSLFGGAFLTLVSLVILFQLPFYLIIISKKEWLKEKRIIRLASLVILILPYLIALALYFNTGY